MASNKIPMTGAWVAIGTGRLAFSFDGGASGHWQVQASGASAAELDAVDGHKLKPGDTIVWSAGAETLFLKAGASVTASVTA